MPRRRRKKVTAAAWTLRRGSWRATPKQIERARVLVVEQHMPPVKAASQVGVARTTVLHWWRRFGWPGKPERPTVSPLIPVSFEKRWGPAERRRRRCEACQQVTPWGVSCVHCGALWQHH